MKDVNKIHEESIFNVRLNYKGLQTSNLKVHNNAKKYYFTERVADTWNRLPAKAVSKFTVIEFKNSWEKHCSIF